jgi:hypothetical protein
MNYYLEKMINQFSRPLHIEMSIIIVLLDGATKHRYTVQ